MNEDDSGEPRTHLADCGGCPLHDAIDAPRAVARRDFLRSASLALASIGLLGANARDARAMGLPLVRDVTALAPASGDRADEKRYPVPAADGVSIDKDNSVIIARAVGKIYAFSLSCPHQNTSLRWMGDEHEFFCPKHKSRYRPDGTFIEGRATRDMDRLVVRRDGTSLVVSVDDLVQQDEHPKEWGAAFVTV